MKGVGSGMRRTSSELNGYISLLSMVTGLIQILSGHPEAGGMFWVAAGTFAITSTLMRGQDRSGMK